MCPHEESTQPISSKNKPALPARGLDAFDLIDGQDKPMYFLHRVDSLIVCIGLALEGLDDQFQGPELEHLRAVVIMVEEALSEACGGLEEVLRQVPAGQA